MIYHSSHTRFYGTYKGIEMLGFALFSAAKKCPYSASAIAIGALAAYHLSQREHLRDEVKCSFDSIKFAVRQMIC